ncbi:hypothetical protein I0D68_18845 [Pseudomonas lalucatii]|nr:hypothetical protein I0D68_18845 [Pseudomonas lalucatii]
MVAPVAPMFEVSAQQLAQAYDRNTVAADHQFKAKRFKVTGVVESINTDLFGNPYVTLRGGVNQFMEPQFELDDAHATYAAGLQSGMRISLICTGTVMWRKRPYRRGARRSTENKTDAQQRGSGSIRFRRLRFSIAPYLLIAINDFSLRAKKSNFLIAILLTSKLNGITNE